MRGPDRAPRRRRTKAEIEAAQRDERVDKLLMVKPTTDGEFMPDAASMTTGAIEEPDEQTVEQFAASVLNSEEYRASLRARAISGRLLPVEARMLADMAKTEPEQKRPSQWRTILEVATPVETEMIANISRRAAGKPEMPIYLPRQTTARTNAEITGELGSVARRVR